MIEEKVGVGLNFAYVGANVKWVDNNIIVGGGDFLRQKVEWTSWSALARINWQFVNSEKVDPYFGFGLGYRDAKWTNTNNDPSDQNMVELDNIFKFGFETTLGIRVKVTDQIGIYSEFGFAKAVAQFGLSARI